MVTHVDDFLVSAERTQLEWLYDQLSQKYELKKAILGPNSDESREVEYLGRRISWRPWGLQYEAGLKHVTELLRVNGMEGCNAVATPAVSDDKSKEEAEDEQELEEQEARAFRRSAAILNYLSQDRPDIAYATKEVARAMSKPKTRDDRRLKRLARYLKGSPRAVLQYPWQEWHENLVCAVDSDWAGCSKTRKSTSGGALYRGRHLLAHWSKTQSVIALSSGEAELNSALKGGVELLGAGEMIREMGGSPTLALHGDSSACQGTLSREGSGRIKHLQVRQLWLQGHIKDGSVRFQKVPRDDNTADALCKAWSTVDGARHFQRMGISFDLRTRQCNAMTPSFVLQYV